MEIKYDIYLVDAEGNKTPSRMNANKEQRDKWIRLLDESEDPNELVHYFIRKHISK